MEEEEESLKKVGKPRNVGQLKKREKFYEEHIDNIVVDGTVVPMKYAIFEELARICDSNVKAEYLAPKRYAEKMVYCNNKKFYLR